MKKEIPNFDEAFWFFDIDDTLIDTAGVTEAASVGIYEVFAPHFGEEISLKMQREFLKIFDLMLAGYRVKNDDWSSVPGGEMAFAALLNKIESVQERVVRNFGAYKKWSREVFIKLAADVLEIALYPDLVHEAAEAYWMKLTELTQVLPGVLELFDAISEAQRPIYFITSSDARLKMDSEGNFEYDPEYSERLKRQRIELLREKGLWFNTLSIGDPEDKPAIAFFEKGIGKAEAHLGSKIDLSKAIMVGDSYAGDLETPKTQLGFGLAVLYKKDEPGLIKNDEKQITTGNLVHLASYL